MGPVGRSTDTCWTGIWKGYECWGARLFSSTLICGADVILGFFAQRLVSQWWKFGAALQGFALFPGLCLGLINKVRPPKPNASSAEVLSVTCINLPVWQEEKVLSHYLASWCWGPEPPEPLERVVWALCALDRDGSWLKDDPSGV